MSMLSTLGVPDLSFLQINIHHESINFADTPRSVNRDSIIVTFEFQATCGQISFLITREQAQAPYLRLARAYHPNVIFWFVGIPRTPSFGDTPSILLGRSMCDRSAIAYEKRLLHRPARRRRFPLLFGGCGYLHR